MGRAMRKTHRPSQLRLLFFLAVFAPCLVLGFLAIRSVNREKAFIEMRLQETIAAELVYTVSVLNSELDSIQQELALAAPVDASSSPQTSLAAWRSRSDLIYVPFLLSPDLEIVWPMLSGSLSENERAFLNWNREFITNQASIPVYQNIALLYKDEITGRDEVSRADKDAEHFAAPQETAAAGKEPQSKMEAAKTEQKALSEFEKNADVRERVYDQARAKGQQTAPRTVAPSAVLTEEEAPQQDQIESIFISQPLRFSQITQGQEHGLIPRIISDSLNLIFWMRDSDGGFVGCVLDRDALSTRMVALISNMFTQTRILTILDENGRPLLIPDEKVQRDWRRPFVAREISARLPRWEVAAYLTDPGAFASRANLTTLILWILVLFLFVAILSGGTYILNRLQGEMQLARQKTTFVANVSHELKTPLTSIRMFAEMLKERRQPDLEKQEKYLNLMVSETDRLTRLINNVLDFTRMERGEQKYEKKRMDIALLCESLVENQRVRLEHNGFAVTFQNDLGEAFISGDEEALMQAMLNLLSNAEKYSEETKRIDVDITRTEGFVMIHVKDHGSGVPARDAKRIFREFYRVDESITSRVRGSGLGLPIALRIIRDHEGDIQYFPRDGGGSVFQIRLPLLAEG